MTTFAVYVKPSKLATASLNIKDVGSKWISSRQSSRVGHQSTDVRSRAHLTATPHSNKHTSCQNKIPTEEDLETVLDFADEEVPYDETGKRCYARACRKLDVVQSSYVLAKLSNSKTIDCKHYGLGPKGTMALSIALVVNSRVVSINLRGNDIGQRGISYIQKMISESHTVTELNISDNKIGSFGANAIHKMLVDNRSLQKLEMSGEDFSSADAILLAKAIQDHPELEHVDLSHNLFDDESAPLFEEMISIQPCTLMDEEFYRQALFNELNCASAVAISATILLRNILLMKNLYNPLPRAKEYIYESMTGQVSTQSHSIADITTRFYALVLHNEAGFRRVTQRPENCAIHTLDLSWNQFRREGAHIIAKGLKENAYLKNFNFSWNGIEDSGAINFAKALKVNNVLKSLDLTCCRIGHDGFMKLITALNLNESLLHLRIGKNNIPEEFAETGLLILRNCPVLKLETLDMTDCTFSPKFAAHIRNLTDMHRHLSVLYGYASSYGKNKKDSVGDILKEGLECLRDFCKESNVSLVELFERFDSDDSMSVSLQEFQEGLKEAGVPLSLYKIELFANALDKDGDGEIDYSELVLQMKSAEIG